MVAILVIGSDSGSREVCSLLGRAAGVTCEGPVGTMADAARAIRRTRPDAVIISDDVQGIDGIEGVRLVHELAPTARVLLVVHDLDVQRVRAAFNAGVFAITGVQPPEEIVKAARSALTGVSFIESRLALDLATRALGSSADQHLQQSRLTRRELEVLRLLAQGLDPRTIADRLHISVHTARGHVKSILSKLGAHSQLEAVVVATNEGLLNGRRGSHSTHRDAPPHLG